MIRQPSTAAQAFAWWRAAVAGQEPPFHDGLPECGYFRTRLVKGGPWVPARIWIRREIDPETGELTDDEQFLCEVDGMRRDPVRAWDGRLIPIARDEYDALIARRQSIPAMQASLARIDLTQTIVSPA